MRRVIGWGVSSWVDDGLSRPAFFTSPIKQKPPALANRGSAYRMKLALTACQSAPVPPRTGRQPGRSRQPERRSEERRVGKERRYRRSRQQKKKNTAR